MIINHGTRSATVQTNEPIESITSESDRNLYGQWNQMCTVYDGEKVRLYENGRLSDTVDAVKGKNTLRNLKTPFSVGSGRIMDGAFTGFIDDVLVCPSVLTERDMIFHRNGDVENMVNTGLVPKCREGRKCE